jgi:hypothetical protein
MVSLIVLIAAGLLTASAVSRFPWSAADARSPRRFGNCSLLQICAGILALGSILLAVHVQQGGFR